MSRCIRLFPTNLIRTKTALPSGVLRASLATFSRFNSTISSGGPTLATESTPLNGLDPILKTLFQAKAKKNLTFESIAKSIGRDEIWVASVFYGQAKPLPKDIEALSDVLELDKSQFQAERSEQWWPNRGTITPMPPTDPVLYRLYEGVMVYGPPIKACLHEKFGDGIISMIDCKVHLERKADPKGDRAVLTFDGKFLPYSTW